MKYVKLKKYFNDNGGYLYRQAKGGHEIWCLNNMKITVPRNNSSDISRVIIWKMEKKLGISKNTLVNY